jgi:lysophospholipase L1-like esterase
MARMRRLPSPAKVVRVVRQRWEYAGERRVHARRADGQAIPQGPGLFVYGHSYMAGFDESEVWPALVAAGLGRPLVNRAVGGDSAADTERRARLVDGRPATGDLVLVQVGLNDVIRTARKRGALDAFRRRLTSIVGVLGGAGATVRVLGDVDLATWDHLPRGHDHGSDEASAAFRAVALSFPGSIDLSTTWDPATMLVPDGVHPNRLGVTTIAETVLDTLR